MADLIDDGFVHLSHRDHIAHLRLNRPDVSNAMSLRFLQALHAAVLRCHAEPDVRVVLLTAAGRNFCTGGDVKEFASQGSDLPGHIREVGSWLHMVASGLINLRAPVITAVQGYAAGGGGLGLVCASDIVLAAHSARFMSGAVRVGMAPDAGTTATLTQLVGLRQAMHLLLANPTIDAHRALEIGLVTDVVDDEDLAPRAHALAAELAAGAPLALSATKNLIWRGIGASAEAQLPAEARLVAELSGTSDAREGLAAVLERRTPHFTGV